MKRLLPWLMNLFIKIKLSAACEITNEHVNELLSGGNVDCLPGPSNTAVQETDHSLCVICQVFNK